MTSRLTNVLPLAATKSNVSRAATAGLELAADSTKAGVTEPVGAGNVHSAYRDGLVALLVVGALAVASLLLHTGVGVVIRALG
jgi:hypothetical protein